MKRISILGSTGSIGQNALDLVRQAPGQYRVVALTGGDNISRLASDAREFGAEIAVTAHENRLAELCDALEGSGIAAASGRNALNEAAARPADWVLSAIVGAAGLEPGLAALRDGVTLALANKESLVSAGPLLMSAAARSGARILPVDSEHSAIFQALSGENTAAVERVIITASGGAFRDWPLQRLAEATVAEASRHPNWTMGQRITIDSASMFNKALEVIEAREYFGFQPNQIEVLVHPQSLVHALVGFRDGGLMAHVGPHDMRHAIGYALNWPDRLVLPVDRLDLAAAGSLEFFHPDHARYPALGLARQVMEVRGLSGAVFNAAKERALDHFIAGNLRFTDMHGIVAGTLDHLSSEPGLIDAEITLDSVHRLDHLGRIAVDDLVGRKPG